MLSGRNIQGIEEQLSNVGFGLIREQGRECSTWNISKLDCAGTSQTEPNCELDV